MELAAPQLARARPLAALARVQRGVLGAWLLGFAPVAYLALRGGGYDIVIYSQVGVAVWWVIAVGALAGVVAIRRPGPAAWAALALLGGFALWTAVALAWTESAERTVAELGRVTSYLGILVLGVSVARRANARALLNGVTLAFGVVALLAVLSRLYPSHFPANVVAQFFPGSQSRLNYPFNYADGTGSFLAMGLALLLAAATRARTLGGRALAAAAVPLAALALLMTASRGAAIAAIAAIVVFYLLADERPLKLASGLVCAAGSAVLIVALLHRAALRHGLGDGAAIAQRHQLAALVLVTCVGVALCAVALGLAERYGARPRWLEISRRSAVRASLAVLAVAVAVAIAAGLPGFVAHQWQLFKQVNPTTSGDVYARLGSAAGSHRYQYWQTALRAFESRPLTGIGPGTFEFYWAQHGPIYEYIRNAHSLYLETLAETGILGGLLICGLVALLVGVAVIRALRAPPSARTALAGAGAALVAFAISAAVDWVWQLAAIPAAALLIAAAVLAHRREPAQAEAAAGPLVHRRALWPRAWWPRLALAAVAVLALAIVAIPYASTAEIRASQAADAAGHYRAALADAATAQRLEPYGASPYMQRALILEQLGHLALARAAVSAAIAREPDYWALWLLRARIDAESGLARAAVSAFRRAHQLDPLSPTTQFLAHA